MDRRLVPVANNLGPLGMVELKERELIAVDFLLADLRRDLYGKGAKLAGFNRLCNIGLRHREPNLKRFALVRRCDDNREVDIESNRIGLDALQRQHGFQLDDRTSGGGEGRRSEAYEETR